MARIISPGADYVPYATTSPAGPEGVFQRIQSTPESFGGLIGAAEQRSGSQLEQGSNELSQAALFQANVYNQAAANKSYADFQTYINNKLGGDPSNPGDRGLFGLSGEDAINARGKVISDIENYRKQAVAQLPSVVARNNFDADSRRLQAIAYEQINSHTEQQYKVYGLSSAQGAATANEKWGALNYNNFDNLRNVLADQDTIASNIANINGQNPQTIGNELKSNTIRSAINGALEHNDYQTANQIMQEFGSMLDPSVGAIFSRELRARSNMAIGVNESQNWGTGQGSAVPGGTTPPAQYKPIIDSAATQYGVPADLLTRVLDAENGFRPTGVSSTGAQGIAQLMPETAARYGVDPNDPNSAIPGAAHYLADLHAQRGSWHAALTGYLGGDPRNDASYTRAGAWQYADQLDRLAPGQTPQAGAPHAAPEVWGDSLGVGLAAHGLTAGHVHGGDTPQAIFDQIKQQPPQSWQGKSIVLSSGTNGDDLSTVQATIQYLKNNGANVAVQGYGSKYADRDQQLQQIAKNTGAIYIAAGANDGTHMSPAGYRDAAQRAVAAFGQTQPPAAMPTPQIAPAQAALGSMPGMTDLANAEAELARKRAQVYIDANASPLKASNPEAWAQGLAFREKELTEQQAAITAQRQAIVEQNKAAYDGYIQQMMDPKTDQTQLFQKIQSDPKLEGMRQELWNVYEAHNKSSIEQEARAGGAGFWNAYQDIVNGKIRYPQQLIKMGGPDGTLTLTGIDTLKKYLGTDDKTTQAEFLKSAHNIISHNGLIPGKTDSRGEEIWNNLLPQLLEKIDGPNGLKSQGIPESEIYGDKGPIMDLVRGAKRSPAQIAFDMQQDAMKQAEEAKRLFSQQQQQATPPKTFEPSAAAIAALRANPARRQEFDEWYGPGSADKVFNDFAVPMAK